MNLPIGQFYHTGIRQDTNNTGIWRRSSDGIEVNLEGWYPGSPKPYRSQDFLYWDFWNNSRKNNIINLSDLEFPFICEYYKNEESAEKSNYVETSTNKGLISLL